MRMISKRRGQGAAGREVGLSLLIALRVQAWNPARMKSSVKTMLQVVLLALPARTRNQPAISDVRLRKICDRNTPAPKCHLTCAKFRETGKSALPLYRSQVPTAAMKARNLVPANRAVLHARMRRKKCCVGKEEREPRLLLGHDRNRKRSRIGGERARLPARPVALPVVRRRIRSAWIWMRGQLKILVRRC